MLVDKCTEFYSRLIKSWFQDSKIKMHLAQKEWKSVVAERFIETWSTKSKSTNIWIQHRKNCILKNQKI